MKLVYSWKGGDENNPEYGSKLDTLVSWTLGKVDGGTHLKLIHSGFIPVKNDSALKSMSGAWKSVVSKLGDVAGAQH